MSIPVTAQLREVRRLSALLALSLDHADSASTATTSQYEETVSIRIPHHHGAIILSSGSVIVAEFDEAADAVNCAIDVSDRFAQYNSLQLDEGTVDAKIAAHFGDVYCQEGKFQGNGVAVCTQLLPRVPVGQIHVTRDIYVRVRMLLPLKFKSVGSELFPGAHEPKEILSVEWEAVTGNLRASLKRLGEDDLQRATSLTTKLGLEASKRALPVVVALVALFLFLLSKILKGH